LSIGFQGAFKTFFLNLIKGTPAEFEESRKTWIAPLLEDPTNPYSRERIVFFFLLHGGYLTKDSRKRDCFKIPNKELLALLKDQLDDYLKNFPIPEETISTLSKALLDQNYEALGDGIAKSIHDYSLMDITPANKKFRKGYSIEGEKLKYYPLDVYIHHLLWKVFESINKDNCHHAKSECGAKGGSNTSDNCKEEVLSTNNSFSSVCAKDGVHFVFNFQPNSEYSTGMKHNSLFALKQIFDKDDNEEILPFENTKAIISIGINANAHYLGLSILKINASAGNYTTAEKLMFQEFKVPKGTDNSAVIIRSNKEEAKIDIKVSAKEAEGGDNIKSNYNNRETMKSISSQISDLMEDPSKLKEKDV
jgi:hypothetical protein